MSDFRETETEQARDALRRLNEYGYVAIDPYNSKIARITSPDFLAEIALSLFPNDMDSGFKWVEAMGPDFAATYYRRMLSNDVLVIPEVFIRSKYIQRVDHFHDDYAIKESRPSAEQLVKVLESVAEAEQKKFMEGDEEYKREAENRLKDLEDELLKQTPLDFIRLDDIQMKHERPAPRIPDYIRKAMEEIQGMNDFDDMMRRTPERDMRLMEQGKLEELENKYQYVIAPKLVQEYIRRSRKHQNYKREMFKNLYTPPYPPTNPKNPKKG